MLTTVPNLATVVLARFPLPIKGLSVKTKVAKSAPFNEDMYNDVLAYTSTGLSWTIAQMDKDPEWNAHPKFKKKCIDDAKKACAIEAMFLGAVAASYDWVAPEERIKPGKLHSGNFTPEEREQMDLLKADVRDRFPELDEYKSGSLGAIAFYCGWKKK